MDDASGPAWRQVSRWTKGYGRCGYRAGYQSLQVVEGLLSFPASDDEPLANFQRALGHPIEEALVDKAKAVRMSEHVALCEFKPGTPPSLHAYVKEQVRRAVAW